MCGYKLLLRRNYLKVNIQHSWSCILPCYIHLNIAESGVINQSGYSVVFQTDVKRELKRVNNLVVYSVSANLARQLSVQIIKSVPVINAPGTSLDKTTTLILTTKCWGQSHP